MTEEYRPSTAGERIGWAMSDLAQAFAEFSESMTAAAEKFRQALRDNEKYLGAERVPDPVPGADR